MSILLNPPPLTRRTTPGRSAAWFALYFIIVIAGGALVGGWLIRLGLEADGGIWHDLIAAHGPSRILRRLQTLLAVLLAPWMLKKIGWRGFNDFGWNSDQSRDERRRDFFSAFGVGLLVMISIFAVSFVTGVREWNPSRPYTLFGVLFSSFLITGIGVGLIEETLARGVLYRSMARAWTPWTAVLVSSLLFAWAHFMKADEESFRQGVWAVLNSALFSDFAKPTTGLKFLNMLMFGLVLCRLVNWRGDIWAAVGLHAAAVGGIKTFSKLTEHDPSAPYSAWIGGHSSKFDDGWLLFLLLLGLLLGIEALNQRSRTSSRVQL